MSTPLDTILSSAASASAPAAAPETFETAPEPQGSAPQGDEAASADPALANPVLANPSAPSEPATVPLAALKEERGKVKRYTEQVADFERKMGDMARHNATLATQVRDLVMALRAPQHAPQPPDFFEDPDGAVERKIAAAIQPILATQGRLSEQMSQQFAAQQHGTEAVAAARAEIERRVHENPDAMRGEFQRIMSSGHPWGELVKWHKNETILKEIGNDPAAYREWLRTEILEELKGQSAAPGTTPGAPVLPTNLAGARNAGTRGGPAYGGPQPLQDIFNRAQRKSRVA
jgi:hypothetical protein